MAKYVVTGGAGFIGSHLVDRLVADGHEVVVVDNLSTGKMENLNESIDRVRFVKGDIRDTNLLRDLFQGADVVFHLAAIASVPFSVKDPVETDSVNAGGTLSVLVAARDAHVRRVVYSASCAVYGDSPELPKTEDMLPNPLSPYAVSKYVGELYCQVFHKTYGLETVCLRYFNVFGPRQDPNSEYSAVIPKFIVKMAKGEPPMVFGDGSQSRDFVFMGDVVNANILAAHVPLLEPRVYNIGSGRSTSLNELVDEINFDLGSAITPKFAARRDGDVLSSCASVDRAISELGFTITRSLSVGLALTTRAMLYGADKDAAVLRRESRE